MNAIAKITTVALLSSGIIFSTPEAAHSILLSELLGGGSIILGDKLASGFGLGIDPTLIDVTSLDDPPFNPGLKYTALDGGLTADGEPIGAIFGFGISTNSEEPLIDGVSLAATDFSFSEIGGAFGIGASVSDIFSNTLGELVVFADNAVGEAQTTDSMSFALQSSIFVEINLQVLSDEIGHSTSLNMFEVRFSQVPEPLSILGAGMAGGIGFFFKRKIKQNNN